jgi:hypothetical protein
VSGGTSVPSNFRVLASPLYLSVFPPRVTSGISRSAERSPSDVLIEVGFTSCVHRGERECVL